MVDTTDLKSVALKGVRVRVPPPAILLVRNSLMTDAFPTPNNPTIEDLAELRVDGSVLFHRKYSLRQPYPIDVDLLDSDYEATLRTIKGYITDEKYPEILMALQLITNHNQSEILQNLAKHKDIDVIEHFIDCLQILWEAVGIRIGYPQYPIVRTEVLSYFNLQKAAREVVDLFKMLSHDNWNYATRRLYNVREVLGLDLVGLLFTPSHHFQPSLVKNIYHLVEANRINKSVLTNLYTAAKLFIETCSQRDIPEATQDPFSVYSVMIWLRTYTASILLGENDNSGLES